MSAVISHTAMSAVLDQTKTEMLEECPAGRYGASEYEERLDEILEAVADNMIKAGLAESAPL